MGRNLQVATIDHATAAAVVAAKHYSKRIGILWEAFGLFMDQRLVGVVTYGQPSAPIQKHAFRNRTFRLYELTRLVVDSGIPNGASILVGRSLRMLSAKPCAVVSYADTEWNHVGIVYQATNWIYTGPVVSHDSLYLVNGERVHPITLRDRHGVTSPAKWAKENEVETLKPKPKHRYFYLVGSKRDCRAMRAQLIYEEVKPYPKADPVRYDSPHRCVDFVAPSLF